MLGLSFASFAALHVAISLVALGAGFVAVAETLRTQPALQELAPTQWEPPFAIAQALLPAWFILMGVLAARRFPGRDRVGARRPAAGFCRRPGPR